MPQSGISDKLRTAEKPYSSLVYAIKPLLSSNNSVWITFTYPRKALANLTAFGKRMPTGLAIQAC